MELLKITHSVVGWQLINAEEFDAEIHQIYEEPDTATAPPEISIEESAPVETKPAPKTAPSRKPKA